MDYWQHCATLRQHALDCRVDMTGRCAIPVDDRAIGTTIAHPVYHPEDLSMVVSAGWVVDGALIDTAKSYGIDYFIVEAV